MLEKLTLANAQPQFDNARKSVDLLLAKAKGSPDGELAQFIVVGETVLRTIVRIPHGEQMAAMTLAAAILRIRELEAKNKPS